MSVGRRRRPGIGFGHGQTASAPGALLALPLTWLRGIVNATLPDSAVIQRYVETSTSDGVTLAWSTLATVACRVSPRAATASEGPGSGGAVVRSMSPWRITLPALTDVTEADRLVVTSADNAAVRTFQVSRVDARSYEAVRVCQCELVE